MHWPIVVLLTGAFQNVTWKAHPLSNNHDLSISREYQWQNYKLIHDKQYDSLEEDLKRKDIYYANLEKIRTHNERYKQGLETFEMGVNHFADLTTDEFERKHASMHAFMNETRPEQRSLVDDKEDDESVDKGQIIWFRHELQWYESAIPVRKQGQCNSCWAFAATALLEYEYYRRNHRVEMFSAQELLDCTDYEYGCTGGWTQKALERVKEKGIHYERDYPYKESKSPVCPEKNFARLAPELGLVRDIGLVKRDEKAIYQRLQYGPVKIAVYASADAFQFYKDGYITPEKCMQQFVNHAVVLLGAINEDNVPLWFLRNSYGPDWGINGHFKLLMGRNTCNILHREAVYIEA